MAATSAWIDCLLIHTRRVKDTKGRCTMRVRYQTFARFIEYFGKKGEIEGDSPLSILSAVRTLAEGDEKRRKVLFQESGEILRYVIILKNKERILNEKLGETFLDEGDELTIYPPVSGG